jgi:hypothetical protein
MVTTTVVIDTGLKGRVVLLPMRVEVLKGRLDALRVALAGWATRRCLPLEPL